MDQAQYEENTRRMALPGAEIKWWKETRRESMAGGQKHVSEREVAFC